MFDHLFKKRTVPAIQAFSSPAAILGNPKMFAAVHLISTSGDHYNLLVEHQTAQDIVDYIKIELHNELAYIDDWYVTAEDKSIANKAVELLETTILELYDSLEG